MTGGRAGIAAALVAGAMALADVGISHSGHAKATQPVVPGIVPVELILTRTPQRAIGLTGIRAYPVGFGCTLHLRLREVVPGEQSTLLRAVTACRVAVVPSDRVDRRRLQHLAEGREQESHGEGTSR